MAEVGARVEETRRRVGDMELRVLSAGAVDAPPLILLHGIAGSADEWVSVMPGLAERFRVYAPDAPGHGFSDKPRRWRYDVEGYASATLATLDALGVERAPVVALSGGGPIALTIALDHPERVEKLVLVDAAGLGREVSWDYRLSSLPGASFAFRRGLTPSSIDKYGQRLLYRRDCLPAGWVDRRLRIWATDGAVEAFFATARACLWLPGQRVTFTSRLQDLRQPTLIVWGRQDPIIPVRHGIAAAQRIPNAQLHIFEECGHVPLWEYPEEFTRQVLTFLRDELTS